MTRTVAFSALFLFFFVSCAKNPTEPVVESRILDQSRITELLTRIRAQEYGDIHSLLIYKDDSLIVEEYFGVSHRDELHVCYSVTKSVTSALIGIAVDKGWIPDLDAPLLNSFLYDSLQNQSAWKSSIRLRDVLSMSAGFQWDEWSYPYTDSRNDVSKLSASPDWMKYMLDLPVIHQPGTRFTYNSGCTMLLSGVLQNATEYSAANYAAQNLFSPLGIDSVIWSSGPNGISNTGWGLRLRAADMLKLGRLFLQRGIWNGQRIVSESWVDSSTSFKISIDGVFDYGYQWWRFAPTSLTAAVLRTNDVFFANGWGGQFIIVVPHLNMVVVSTGGNFLSGNEALAFFRLHILPAAYNAIS